MKYQITIRDNESGKTHTYDADFYDAYIIEDHDGIRVLRQGRISPLELVHLHALQEKERENDFNEHPELRVLYLLRDSLVKETAQLDIGTLERMMEGRQNETDL